MNPQPQRKLTIEKVFNPIFDSRQFFYYVFNHANLTQQEELIPYIKDVTYATFLDNLYFMSYSSEKQVSPMVEKLDSANDDELSDLDRDSLAVLFFKLYADDLLKAYNLYQLEYSPINNYTMQENTSTSTETEVSEENEEHLGSTSRGSITDTDSVWGFNSSEAVPERQKTRAYNNHGENTNRNGTNTSNSTVTGQIASAKTGSTGIYTPQSMIKESFEIWETDFYNKFLFPRVDKILTSYIY